MNWIETEGHAFIYSNKGMVRRKRAVFHTVFGTFEVFQSVSGKNFCRHPMVKNDYIGPTGFDNGTADWFGPCRQQCTTFEDGKRICEAVLEKLKTIVSNY